MFAGILEALRLTALGVDGGALVPHPFGVVLS
jgi:hypothetical protein